MKQRCLLLLDDMPGLARHFATQLAGLGWQCRSVHCLEEAVTALDREGSQTFHACFVELHLSSGNGYSAGRALMECSGLPCVLLAGPAKPTDRMWAQRLGFTSLLERPCTRASLASVLETLAPSGHRYGLSGDTASGLDVLESGR